MSFLSVQIFGRQETQVFLRRPDPSVENLSFSVLYTVGSEHKTLDMACDNKQVQKHALVCVFDWFVWFCFPCYVFFFFNVVSSVISRFGRFPFLRLVSSSCSHGVFLRKDVRNDQSSSYWCSGPGVFKRRRHFSWSHFRQERAVRPAAVLVSPFLFFVEFMLVTICSSVVCRA